MKKKFTQEELKDYMNIVNLIASSDKESSKLGWDLLSYNYFYNQFLKEKNSSLLGYKIDKIVRYIQTHLSFYLMESEDQFYQESIMTLRFPFRNFNSLNNRSLLQKIYVNLTEDTFLTVFDLFKETKFYRKHFRKKYNFKYIFYKGRRIECKHPISLESIDYTLKHHSRYFIYWYHKEYIEFLNILQANLR